MADFTLAQIAINESQPSSQKPVELGPTGVETALSLFSAIAPTGQQLAAKAEQRQKVATGQVLEAFTQDSLRIADSVEMGETSSRAARMKMRRLYSSYAANNPLLLDELSSTHKNVITTSGLGKVVAEGTEEEGRVKKQIDAAFERGWATADMPPQEQLMMAENMRSFDLHMDMLAQEKLKMEFANAELTNQRAHIGIKSDRIGLSTAGMTNKTAQLNLQRTQASVAADRAVVGLSMDYGPVFRKRAGAILERAKGPRTPDQINQDAMELEDLYASSIGSLRAQLGAGGSAEQVNSIIKPFDSFMEHARQVINGKQELDTLETANTAMIQRQTHVMLGDPDTRALVASTELFGDTFAMETVVAAKALNIYANVTKGLEPAPIFPAGDPTKSNDYFDLTEQTLDLSNSGKAGEGVVTEAGENINQILAAVGSREGQQRQPQEFNKLGDLLASDKFGQFIEKNPATISQENVSNAVRVFDDYYYGEIIPVIEDRWQQAKVKVRTNPDATVVSAFRPPKRNELVSGVINVEFDGGGIRFKSSRNEGDALRETGSLNKELAPVLNKLIRMGAHLEGHRNYRKFFEENYRGIFESEGMEGGDAR